LRLRVSPSELARLLDTGRIEETTHFGPESDAKLTYALEHTTQREISLRYHSQEVTVILPTVEAQSWSEGERVGIYGEVDIGNCNLALARISHRQIFDCGGR
jgi:hypothetical protein